MSEIRVTSVVGENGGDRVGLTTGLTVGPLTGTTGIGATITHQGHAQFAGVCTATSFVGSGANLTNISAGKVLQVVSVVYTTTASNTTATFADTGLTATISISAGSKVLIITSQQLDVSRSSSVDAAGAVKLLRGSTDIFAPGNNKSFGFEGASSSKAIYITLTSAFLDTGASTGSNTYKTQFRVKTASNSEKIRINDDSGPSTMTLLEIA